MEGVLTRADFGESFRYRDFSVREILFPAMWRSAILSGELHTNCEIDVSSLSPGIYVLRLKTESGYYTIKFLKS
jgi:hypothetical protein